MFYNEYYTFFSCTMDKKLTKNHLRFVLLLAFIGLSIVLANIFSIDAEKIDAFFEQIPMAYSGFIFVILYIVGTFFLWHLKDPLKIVGAVIFGAYISTLLIYIAEIVNAYIFFNLSHFLGKGFVEGKLRGKFKNFYEKIENMNMGWLFLMRGVPLIPYRILDLSFGLSKYPFKKYLVIVLSASLPRIFFIQFILAAIRGFSIEAMTQYFMDNMVVCWILFFYYMLGVVVAFKIKQTNKKK